jgi:ATP/maltotriose-dependent transcriptional regulator MalT
VNVAELNPERIGECCTHIANLDSVAGNIRELALALRAIAAEPSSGLPAAIRDGRERLHALEVDEEAKGDGASAALLEACNLLLDRLDETAVALEASRAEGARDERLRIISVLAQLIDSANIADPRISRAGMSPHVRYPNTPTTPAGSMPIHPLTSQEQTVLELLATGAGTLQIAQSLTISPKTAKKHVCNILEKLGVRDRLSAVLRGQELGLLPSVAPTWSQSVRN